MNFARVEHGLRQLRAHPLTFLARVASRVRAQLSFGKYELGARVSSDDCVRASGQGRIEVGDGVHFAGGMLRTELISHSGALLHLGTGSLLNYGVSIEAHQLVSIGERCLFASQVRVADSAEGRCAAIVIGDDVWLAYGVVIMPGVTIGSGAVISAGSVVRSDVPGRSLARGNPALSTPLRPEVSAVPEL